jgi:hypothetical protein
MNDHAMSYLQCTASLAEGEQAERLWLDARAVFDCQFDMDGRLNAR